MAKFARVTFGEGDPAQMDEGIANLNETVIPEPGSFPDFKVGIGSRIGRPARSLPSWCTTARSTFARPMRSLPSFVNKWEASPG